MNEITLFAYTALAASVAAEVQAAAMRIKVRMARTVEDIIETGRDLLDVKSKLEHGQFESWLDLSFNMTIRTAQRFMRAAEWAEGKNDIVSHLTSTTVYMLSAKSTPEAVHEQVVERLEGGLPAEPEYVRHVILDAKIREREAKKKKGKREARAAQKRRETRREREYRKREEERLRREAAAITVARHVANILVAKLSGDETNKVCKALDSLDVTKTMLREAITEARGPHNDNMAVPPPKPWAKS